MPNFVLQSSPWQCTWHYDFCKWFSLNNTNPRISNQLEMVHILEAHCEPGGASFSSHNMQKWLFHPFLRWINGEWIEIVFSSSKIHTLNMWNSFVSIMIFSSYYKWRKNVHDVFSSLDQFRLKFPNIVFLSALADEKYKWGFFIPGSISAKISKCSFFICFSWWKVHMRFFIPGWISAKFSKCSFFICFS